MFDKSNLESIEEALKHWEHVTLRTLAGSIQPCIADDCGPCACSRGSERPRRPTNASNTF